jgi:hypothetical protein
VRRRGIVKVVKFGRPNVEIDVGGGSLFPHALGCVGASLKTLVRKPHLPTLNSPFDKYAIHFHQFETTIPH